MLRLGCHRGARSSCSEGPEIEAVARDRQFAIRPGMRFAVAVFSSEGCAMPRAPAASRCSSAMHSSIEVFDECATTQPGRTIAVPGSCAVVLGLDGTVLARGRSTRSHSWRASSRRRSGAGPRVSDDGLTGALARGTSRRGFSRRVPGACSSSRRRSVACAVRSGEADAYHFCGHIHDRLLPAPNRAAAHRRPRLSAPREDGKPVDDLGRRSRSSRAARGRPWPAAHRPGRTAAPAGAALARARTRSAGYGMRTWVDGSWYRCCGGRVRKLVDCCSRSRRRINGDRSLTGYCFKGERGLLRSLLRHEGAVLTLVALGAAAALAGLTGAWSPCGFSMMGRSARPPGGRAPGGVRRSPSARCRRHPRRSVPGVPRGGAPGLGTTAAVAVADRRGMLSPRSARRAGCASCRRCDGGAEALAPDVAAAQAAGYGVLLGLGFVTFVLTLAFWALAAIALAVGDLSSASRWDWGSASAARCRSCSSRQSPEAARRGNRRAGDAAGAAPASGSRTPGAQRLRGSCSPARRRPQRRSWPVRGRSQRGRRGVRVAGGGRRRRASSRRSGGPSPSRERLRSRARSAVGGSLLAWRGTLVRVVRALDLAPVADVPLAARGRARHLGHLACLPPGGAGRRRPHRRAVDRGNNRRANRGDEPVSVRSAARRWTAASSSSTAPAFASAIVAVDLDRGDTWRRAAGAPRAAVRARRCSGASCCTCATPT